MDILNYFATEISYTSEELLNHMDTFLIMSLIEVGKGLEAQIEDDLKDCKDNGSEQMYKNISRVQKLFNRNYTALKGAYKIAMT